MRALIAYTVPSASLSLRKVLLKVQPVCSYPKKRTPSFYCAKETGSGLTLHYRSRRVGYIAYVMGQLISIAKIYYNTDVTVEVTELTLSSYYINMEKCP